MSNLLFYLIDPVMSITAQSLEPGPVFDLYDSFSHLLLFKTESEE